MSFQPGTLDEHIVRYPTLRMEEEKRKKINEEFALFLMTENRPNNLVNSQPLKRILNHLNPSYDLPNADVMKKIQIDKMLAVDEIITKSLEKTSKYHNVGGKQFPFLTLVWDAWTKSYCMHWH